MTRVRLLLLCQHNPVDIERGSMATAHTMTITVANQSNWPLTPTDPGALTVQGAAIEPPEIIAPGSTGAGGRYTASSSQDVRLLASSVYLAPGGVEYLFLVVEQASGSDGPRNTVNVRSLIAKESFVLTLAP